MSDTDGLAAETRRLLDAATKGPWTRPSDTANWFTVPQPIQIDEADWGQEAQENGAMCGYRIGTLADERAWRYADVALIAAAPRLLANWLACGQADDRQVQALIDANRDLADENRALRELAGFLIDACATHRIDVPINLSLLDLAADIAGGGVLAAADRGDTNGDRNEGDER